MLLEKHDSLERIGGRSVMYSFYCQPSFQCNKKLYHLPGTFFEIKYVVADREVIEVLH